MHRKSAEIMNSDAIADRPGKTSIGMQRNLKISMQSLIKGETVAFADQG